MERFIEIVLPAIPETIYMVGISSILSVLIGIPLGIILYTSQEGGLSENEGVYKVLDSIVNVFRSLPFVVLMLVVTPLTVLIVGKRIGSTASIVPLTVSAIPFMARVIEGNLNEVDKGIVEAARAMGSPTGVIVRRVVLKEAMPLIVQSITLVVINLIGQSAIVGMIGGGGLGDIAIRYGYNRNQTDILLMSCIVIIILVQLIQIIGNSISKAIDKK